MDAQNIFLVGLMAVGKSTVGRQLADALAMPFFDADQEVERRAGAEISWIFDVEGEQGFRDREATVIDDLTQRQGIVLATGGGAILREENRRHLAERGIVIHLDSPIEKIIARTRRDATSHKPAIQPKRCVNWSDCAARSMHRSWMWVVTDNKGAGSVTKDLKILERRTPHQKARI